MADPVELDIPSRFDAPWLREVGKFEHRWENADADDSLLAIERVIEATVFDDAYKGKLEPVETYEYRQRLVVKENDIEAIQAESPPNLPYTVKLIDGIPTGSTPVSGEAVLKGKFDCLIGVLVLVTEFVDIERLEEICEQTDNLGGDDE